MTANIFWVFALFVIVNIVLGIIYDKEIKASARDKHYLLAILEIAKDKGGWRRVLVVSYFSMILLAVFLVCTALFLNGDK